MDDHHRLEIGIRVLVAEPDQRIDIAEAGILRTRCQPLEHGARAIARLDHDIEPLGAEITLVLCRQERRRQRIEAPIQREADRRAALSASGMDPREAGNRHPHHRELTEPAPAQHRGTGGRSDRHDGPPGVWTAGARHIRASALPDIIRC